MTNASSSFASTAFGGLFAIAASALILGFAAGPAQAGQVEVKVFAHELATPQGRALVDARIERAAEKACGHSDGSRDLKTRHTTSVCVADAIEATGAQLAAIKASTQLAAR